MDEPIGIDLLRRYNNGTATEKEVAMVESWFIDYPLDDRPILNHEDTQADLDEIRLKLIEISNKPKYRKKSYWIAAAAILFFVFSVGLYYYSQLMPRGATTKYAVNDIHPGHYSATLTLASGSKIILDGKHTGKLAEQLGVSISKDEDGQVVYHIDAATRVVAQNSGTYNTLSTAKGEQYQISLPDGTKVWLNAASSLKYSPSFASLTERNVQLSGEAYFEVAKDIAHPFIVECRGQKIRVLGTHFNVNAYTDEKGVRTTLLEGSININDKAVLKPGQESLFSSFRSIEVYKADTDVAMAWKKGEFIFRNAELPAIMRQISRWYNLEVVYDGTLNNDTYNGVIDRRADLSRILKIMERGGVQFKVQGRKLIVTP